MKRFLTTVIGVLLLGIAMTLVMTVGATVQETFWNDIAQGNMAEIAAANLALQRSQNEQVKQFAQQMVTDHTAAGTELQSLASSKNVTLPAAIAAKQQSEMDKLGGRSGTDFDREFIKMMIRDHDRMAKLLSREAERNSDADIKRFAAKTYPVVQNHLSMARSLNDTLRGNSGNSGNNGRNEAGDTVNSNSNRSSNMNDNTAAAGNDNSSNSGYSNLRPNVNPNANTTTNSRSNSSSNRSSGNTNSRTNSNSNRSNGNTNSNSNNSNSNRQ